MQRGGSPVSKRAQGTRFCGDAARLLKDYTDYRTACEQEAERQAAEQAAREEAERVTNKQERQHGALRLLEGMQSDAV